MYTHMLTREHMHVLDILIITDGLFALLGLGEAGVIIMALVFLCCFYHFFPPFSPQFGWQLYPVYSR